MVILPTMLIGTFLSIASVIYLLINALRGLADELAFLKAVNFQFTNAYELNSYMVSRVFYSLFSHPIFLLTVFFIFVSAMYLLYARKQLRFNEPLKINFILFLGLYSFLFAFWWIISSFYLIFNKRVIWGEKRHA